MSLFSKKPKEESKEANEEPRDDYIELGTTAHIADGYQITQVNRVYNATFDEMVARIGNVTTNKENGTAFIVQQFMTIKEHNELIENHSNCLDNQTNLGYTNNILRNEETTYVQNN